MTSVGPTNTSCCSGLQALHSIAVTCKGFLGPERRVKLITEDDGCEAVFTTQKLISLLDIEHPVGHLLRDACLTHSKRIGSGCTTLVCMAGTWANAIQSLLNEGISAETIILLGDRIVNMCVDVCKEESIDCSEIIDPLETARCRNLHGTENYLTEKIIQQNEVEGRSSQVHLKQCSVIGEDDFKPDQVDLSLDHWSKNLEISKDSKIDVNYSDDDLSWYFDVDPFESDCQPSDSLRTKIDGDSKTANKGREGSSSLDLSKVTDISMATYDNEDVGWYLDRATSDSSVLNLQDTRDTMLMGVSPSNQSSLDLLEVSNSCEHMDIQRTRSNNGQYYIECNDLRERISLTGRILPSSAEDENFIPNLVDEVDFSNDDHSILEVTSCDRTKSHVTADNFPASKSSSQCNQITRNHQSSGILEKISEDIEASLNTLNINVKAMKSLIPSKSQVLRNSRHFRPTLVSCDNNSEEATLNDLIKGNGPFNEPSAVWIPGILRQSPVGDGTRDETGSVSNHGGNNGKSVFSPAPIGSTIRNSSSDVAASKINDLQREIKTAASSEQRLGERSLKLDQATLHNSKCIQHCSLHNSNNIQHCTSHNSNSIQHCDLDVSSWRRFCDPAADDYVRVKSFQNLCENLSHGAESSMDLAKQLCLKQLENNIPHRDPFVCQAVGPSVSDSIVADGLVLRCELDQLPLVSSLRYNSLRGVLINGDLTPRFRHPGFKGPMEVNVVTHSLSQNIRSSHLLWLDKIKQILQELQISLILVKGHVDTRLLDHCLANNILVISLVPYVAMDYLSDVTDTPLNVYFSDITQDDICHNLRVDCWEAGWHSVVRILETKKSAFIKVTGRESLHTVMICGPSNPHVEEQRAKFWSSYHRLRDLLKARRVCLGGAITELKVLRKLEQLKDSLERSGSSHQELVEKMIIEAFQEGLEEFIIWLVLNRGDSSKFDIKTAIRSFISSSTLDAEAVLEIFFSDRKKEDTTHIILGGESAGSRCMLTNDTAIAETTAVKSTNSLQHIISTDAKIGRSTVEASLQNTYHCTDGVSCTDSVSQSALHRNICLNGKGTSNSSFPHGKTGTTSVISKAAKTSLTDRTDGNSQTAIERLPRLSLHIHEVGIVLDSVTSKTEAWHNAWSLIKSVMSIDSIVTTGLKQSQIHTQSNILM